MFQAHHLLCSISTFLVQAESNAGSLSARTGDDNAPKMLIPSVNVLTRKLYCITIPRCLFTQLRLRIERVSQGRLRDGNDCNHLSIHPCSQSVRVHLWYSTVDPSSDHWLLLSWPLHRAAKHTKLHIHHLNILQTICNSYCKIGTKDTVTCRKATFQRLSRILHGQFSRFCTLEKVQLRCLNPWHPALAQW